MEVRFLHLAPIFMEQPTGYSPYQDIGICDQCGGTVRLFTGPYWSTVPPVPTCSRCGAVERKELPIMKMTGGRHPKRQVFDAGQLLGAIDETIRSSTAEHSPLKGAVEGSSPSESTKLTCNDCMQLITACTCD